MRKRIIISTILLICLILEILHGSVQVMETISQGKEIVYHQYNYCDFSIWGHGYWIYNIVFICTIISFICGLLNIFSGITLTAVVQFIGIVMLYPCSFFTYIIEGLMISACIVDICFKRNEKR